MNRIDIDQRIRDLGPVTPVDREQFLPYMGNWISISKQISTMESPEDILLMIKIEAQTKKRPEIIFRLHSRYNSLRRGIEREFLMSWINAQ